MRHKTDPADQTVVNDGTHQADNEDDDDDDVSNFTVLSLLYWCFEYLTLS